MGKGTATGLGLLVALTSCADGPAEPSGPVIGDTSAPIQMGTPVDPSEALKDGVVRLDLVGGIGGALDPTCTATMIGPRTLLTAEHCLRVFDKASKKWGAVKTSVTPLVPGGPSLPDLWKSGTCGLAEGLPEQPDPLPSAAPTFTIKRPFFPGALVVPRLLPPRLLFQAIKPQCRYAALGTPRADVAVLRLPEGMKSYPVWPIRTGLDGGPTDAFVGNGSRLECVGYGQDSLPLPGQSKDAGRAKLGVVTMSTSVGLFKGDDGKPLQLANGSIGLFPFPLIDPNNPGQLPDKGDSGAGCVAKVSGDAAQRRVTGVATEAYGEGGGPKLVGLAARTDAFLPWLERMAYTRPASFGDPVDTVISKTASTADGWDWDDGASFFADVSGDGLDDFVYYGDKNNLWIMYALGDGSFGSPMQVPHAHNVDPALIAVARWSIVAKPIPPSRGYRSKLVTSTIVSGPLGPGLALVATPWGLPGMSNVWAGKLPGEAWQNTTDIIAATHFDPENEALIVRRTSDPAVPGDNGAVTMIPGRSDGGFDVVARRQWNVPSADYGGLAFSLADIDGDGGAELIADRGAELHVFKAIKGGSSPWASIPTLLPVPEGCRYDSSNPGSSVAKRSILDVTGDGLADYVCVNGDDTGLIVRRGMVGPAFDTAAVTPFEISGHEGNVKYAHPWHDSILADLDGDGLRDFVTFFDSALWFKLGDGTGNQTTGFTSQGYFGGLQRFPLPSSYKATFGRSFEAPHVRANIPRSVVVATYRQDNVPVLREMRAWPAQDR